MDRRFPLASLFVGLAALAACTNETETPMAYPTDTGDGGAAVPGAATPPVLFLEEGGAGPVAGDAGVDAPFVPFDPGPSAGRVIWGVDQQGRLVRFGTASLGQVAVRAISGLLTGDRIVSLDFRPSTGALFGLGQQNRIYTIDPATGTATVVGSAPFVVTASGQAQGFDFNPVADRIRVHTDVDLNLRIDPSTGAVSATDTALRFAPADVNAGQSPNLVATAYTNSVSPAPGATALYAIDSTRNLLTRIPSPNDGLVETVGTLGVDATEVAGFDIWGTDAAREVYAALREGGSTGLYTIDLTTGAATLVGVIGHAIPLSGIAVAP